VFKDTMLVLIKEAIWVLQKSELKTAGLFAL
jgi:hypothetical protein